MRPLKTWLWNTLIAIDQLFNTLLGGWPDETFSSRTYRQAVKGKRFWCFMRRFIDALFFWEEGHCYKSYEKEINTGHRPF